jgi:hypothetical protein
VKRKRWNISNVSLKVCGTGIHCINTSTLIALLVLDLVWGVFNTHDVSGVRSTHFFRWLVTATVKAFIFIFILIILDPNASRRVLLLYFIAVLFLLLPRFSILLLLHYLLTISSFFLSYFSSFYSFISFFVYVFNVPTRTIVRSECVIYLPALSVSYNI